MEWDVAATSESRAGWPVRTATHRRLRDHSLVSSCRQRQLRQIFAWISEWYDNTAAETTKQPKFYEYLRDGGFVVRLSSRRFNAVATDQALEQTINPDGRAREVSSGSPCGWTL